MAKLGDRVRADRVVELRSKLGFTQATLAAAVQRAGGKLSQQQAGAIEKGDVSRPGALPEIARVLHTTPDFLLGKTDDPARPLKANMEEQTPPDSRLPNFVTGSNIPVWHGSVPGGKMGEVLLREKHIDTVTRPKELAGALEALAFVIQDGLQDPAFRIGDIAYVNPVRPAIAGEDCLLVRPIIDGPERQYLVLARYLVSSTTTHWLVRQFEPRKQYELSKAEWPQCWKILGKYSR